MIGKTKKNDFGETIATDWCKTSDTLIVRTIMIGTGKREAATITTIVMIEITLLAIISEERSNGGTMKTGIDKDIGTINALIRNGTLGKMIIGSRQRSTNESQRKE